MVAVREESSSDGSVKTASLEKLCSRNCDANLKSAAQVFQLPEFASFDENHSPVTFETLLKGTRGAMKVQEEAPIERRN